MNTEDQQHHEDLIYTILTRTKSCSQCSNACWRSSKPMTTKTQDSNAAGRPLEDACLVGG